MYVSFVSPAYDPSSFSYHHASIKERVMAARYANEAQARGVIDLYTNIPQKDVWAYRHAVACVQSDAKGMQEAKQDVHGRCYIDIIMDGLSVEEQLAKMAVESVNETICEAMVS